MQLFISSTSEDLQLQRNAVRDVAISLGWQPRMMKYFATRPGATVAECLKEVAQCQLFILIVAFRRGWVPTIEQDGDGKRSITALELEQAETLNIPTLTFLADDSWPVRLVEDSEGAFNWMRDFRNGLSRIATFFAFEQSVSTAADGVPIFRSKVREAFLNLREHQDHGGHVSAVQATPSASKPDDPPVRLKEPELSSELPPYHIQFWNLTSIRARSQEEIANWTKSCDNYACRD